MSVEWVHQKQRNIASIFDIEILEQFKLSVENPHEVGKQNKGQAKEGSENNLNLDDN